MTNREAIKLLKTILRTVCLGNQKFIDAVKKAISALEKQEWHNARKEPPKKPDNIWDTYYVYTRFDRYGIARYYAHGKWDGYDEDGDQIGEYEIIAYCNFKPYTEEDNDKS